MDESRVVLQDTLSDFMASLDLIRSPGRVGPVSLVERFRQLPVLWDQMLDRYQVDTFAKPAGVPFPQASQFDHLSLALADEEALHRLQARLKANDCEVTDVVDHGIMRSIYFTDPNGIALEASWWTLDATGRPADFGDDRFFSDPDPVPSVVELRETGQVAHTVPTRLVDEITRDLYKPT